MADKRDRSLPDDRGGGAAARVWARSDLRRRWRSLVVLGVLAGLTAGLAMAATAGARRSATAFPRLREQTLAADAIVFPSQVGAYHPDWGPLMAKDYVTKVARWNLCFGNVDGDPGGLLFTPSDHHWFGDVDRPVVVAGRMFDRNAADEMVVDEEAAKQGNTLGTVVTFKPYGPDQTDYDTEVAPNGPEIRLKVVGVIRQTSQFLFVPGFAFPSPGVITRYGSQMSLLENAHVRVRNPGTDLARLRDDANALLAPGTPILDLHAVERRIATSIRVEELAELALAALVALAGLVFVGQALARSASVVADSRTVLSAIGLTRRQLALAGALPHGVVAALGVAGGFAAAVALSPRFPIGYGGRVDPDRGVNLDWTVLGPGAIVTALVVLLAAFGVAWARTGRPRALSGQVGTGLVARLRGVTPVSIGLGATSAFDSGRGRRSIPVRPALAGTMAGVLGIVGTITIDRAFGDAIRHPERAGVTWQAFVRPALNAYRVDGLDPFFVDDLLAQADVAEVSLIDRRVSEVEGVGVPVFSVQRLRGDVDLVAVEGRAPRGPGEAAIGSATAAQLGVGIGDQVAIGTKRHEVLVVGTALFPYEVHSGFTEGLWLTREGLANSVVLPATQEEFEDDDFGLTVNLRWADGVDSEKALARLGERLGPRALEVNPADIPPELTNLKNVRVLPAILGVFLVFLALTTLAHGLVTTVRRRRHEFAVLRALGFTRRMTRTMVAAQSTAVGLFGLAAGIPLGYSVGRAGWTWVASEVPLVYVSPVSLFVVVVLVPSTLVLANLLAALPGWRASRLRPSEVLRTE